MPSQNLCSRPPNSWVARSTTRPIISRPRSFARGRRSPCERRGGFCIGAKPPPTSPSTWSSATSTLSRTRRTPVLAYRTADRRYRQALRTLSTRTTVMPRGIENAPRAGAHAHGAPAPREPFFGSVTVMAMMTPVSFSSASGAVSGLSVKPRSASRRMTINSSGMSLL
ncbi:MAG: hypothetical protein V7640_2127 [Betaproteobacteria bacterium]